MALTSSSSPASHAGTQPTFAEAEAFLRERIAALREADSLYQCAREQVQLTLVRGDLLEYLRGHLRAGAAPSREHHDSVSDELGYLLCEAAWDIVATLFLLWVLYRLIRWTVRRLSVRAQLHRLYARAQSAHALIRNEMHRRVLSEASLRAARTRRFYTATVQCCLGFAVILALGSLGPLANWFARQSLGAWWANVISGEQQAGGAGSFAGILMATGKAAFVSWKAREREAARGSHADPPQTSASRGLSSLLGGMALSLQSLYLWYAFGSALLGMALYLANTAAQSMKDVLRSEEEVHRGPPRVLQRVLDEEAKVAQAALANAAAQQAVLLDRREAPLLSSEVTAAPLLIDNSDRDVRESLNAPGSETERKGETGVLPDMKPSHESSATTPSLAEEIDRDDQSE